jgi:hypothetical protein
MLGPASADPSMFHPMLVIACLISVPRDQSQVLMLPACFPSHATKEMADGQQVPNIGWYQYKQ